MVPPAGAGTNRLMGLSDRALALGAGRSLVFAQQPAAPTETGRVLILLESEKTMTGGRIKRARSHFGDEPFCLTYGDGVSDINVTDLIAFHHRSGALVTVSAVRPPGRFRVLDVRPGSRADAVSRR